MSKWYKVAKRNYESGRWSLEMLRNVLDAGRITEDEFHEIVGVSDSDTVATE